MDDFSIPTVMRLALNFAQKNSMHELPKWQQYQMPMGKSVADYAVTCNRILNLETRIAALEAALTTGEK